VRDFAESIDELLRQHAPAALVVRVLDTDEPRHREVVIRRPDCIENFVDVQRAVMLIAHHSWMDAGDGRGSSLLIDVNVRLGDGAVAAAAAFKAEMTMVRV